MRQSVTIKFFNHSRGFGFIAPEDGSKDVFVHITALERSGIGQVLAAIFRSNEAEAAGMIEEFDGSALSHFWESFPLRLIGNSR